MPSCPHARRSARRWTTWPGSPPSTASPPTIGPPPTSPSRYRRPPSGRSSGCWGWSPTTRRASGSAPRPPPGRRPGDCCRPRWCSGRGNGWPRSPPGCPRAPGCGWWRRRRARCSRGAPHCRWASTGSPPRRLTGAAPRPPWSWPRSGPRPRPSGPTGCSSSSTPSSPSAPGAWATSATSRSSPAGRAVPTAPGSSRSTRCTRPSPGPRRTRRRTGRPRGASRTPSTCGSRTSPNTPTAPTARPSTSSPAAAANCAARSWRRAR